MNPYDLIRIARHLATGGVGGNRGRPRQADLRRAVSTTYYALFHALSRCCADILAGSTPAHRRQRGWQLVYRSLEHGPARSRLDNKSEMQSLAAATVREYPGPQARCVPACAKASRRCTVAVSISRGMGLPPPMAAAWASNWAAASTNCTDRAASAGVPPKANMP